MREEQAGTGAWRPGPRAVRHPARGVLRGLRAAVLASLCVLLPSVGHVLGRGHLPAPVVLALFGAAALVGCVDLRRRRLSDVHLLGALAAAQLAYHAVYELPGIARWAR